MNHFLHIQPGVHGLAPDFLSALLLISPGAHCVRDTTYVMICEGRCMKQEVPLLPASTHYFLIAASPYSCIVAHSTSGLPGLP